jgi:methylated-DNA-[protein]-cysteine S-methyltransferase
MKKQLRQLLQEQRLDEIAELAMGKRRVLGLLISLTYDRDPLIGWRAIEAMGAATELIGQNDPECVRNQMRRLYWLITEESGGICWHAPEAMAEIVHRSGDTLSDYVPIIVWLLREMAEEDLIHFRSGILWAIGRLGPMAEKQVDAVAPTITECLDHADPQVRGMAVWCLAQCGRQQLLVARDDLLSDEATFTLYQDGQLDDTRIGQLMRQAVGDQAMDTRSDAI